MPKKYTGEVYTSVVTIVTIVLYYYSNVKRIEAGYFENPLWITINTFSYILFFAVITGYVVSKVMRKKR